MKRIFLFALLATSYQLAIAQQPAYIYGGDEIDIKEAAWQVLIVMKNGAKCGGTIIAKRYILTAGHNLYRSSTSAEQVAPSEITVIPGISYVGEIHTTNNKYSVKSFTIHQNYNHRESSLGYDIAILELTKDISGENVKVISIATPNNTTEYDVAVGKKAILTGYGRSDRRNNNEESASRLRKVEMPITESGTYLLKFYAEGKSVGKGDSGGPAVIVKGGTHYLVGVASHLSKGPTSPLGTDGNSSNYVNIRTHANWINTIAKTDQVTGLRDCRNFAGNNVQITKGREDNRYCNYTANDINGLSYRWESLTSGAYVRGSSTSVVVLSASNSPIYYTVRLTVSQTTSSGTCSSSKTVSGCLNCYTWSHGGFGNGGSSNTGRGGGRLMAKPEPIEETKASEPAEKYAYQASPIVNSYPNPAKGQLRVSILEKIDDEAFAARSSGNKKQEIEWISSQDISTNGDVRLPQPATLVLYDRNLQVRYQGESQISPATIPLEGLSQGIYFLHVNYKGKTRQQKIVVD